MWFDDLQFCDYAMARIAPIFVNFEKEKTLRNIFFKM